MAKRSEQVTTLLSQMEDIEAIASSFQDVNLPYKVVEKPEELTSLREKYYEWFAQACSLFADKGAALQVHYRKIHTYLADPFSYGSRQTLDRRGGTVYYFKAPFDGYFKQPFNEQRLLLTRLRANYRKHETEPAPPALPAIDTIRLHPRVRAVSRKLFDDGHFRQAILRAAIALNNAVQERSGRTDLDGSKLMQQVFSPSKPILQFDGHPDEQQGFMWLFSGVIMAIRNPRAHQVGEAEDLDANETVELLALISYMFRVLDRAEKATTTNP